MIIGICSLYANPLHNGHLEYLKAAKNKCHYLCCIVNNDEQVKLKGAIPFLDEQTRANIVSNLAVVDFVTVSSSLNGNVASDIEKIYNWQKLVFDFANNKKNKIILFNGGDRQSPDLIEAAICRKYGIEMQYGVGGIDKINSSSKIIEDAAKEYIARQKQFRPQTRPN